MTDEALRERIAAAIFEISRQHYAGANNLVRIDRGPLSYMTWEMCDQEPFWEMADAVLAEIEAAGYRLVPVGEGEVVVVLRREDWDYVLGMVESDENWYFCKSLDEYNTEEDEQYMREGKTRCEQLAAAIRAQIGGGA